MKNVVDQLKAASTPSSIGVDGRKLDNEQPVSMEIEAHYAGPASHSPDSETPIGCIDEVTVIKAPDDADAQHDPPNIWADVPSWMLTDRWR